jgi:hypothetical protein
MQHGHGKIGYALLQNNKKQDVIKVIHYINSHWNTKPMWKNNPYFKNMDARITKRDSLKTWWLAETSQEKYLKASDTLFSYLSTSK